MVAPKTQFPDQERETTSFCENNHVKLNSDLYLLPQSCPDLKFKALQWLKSTGIHESLQWCVNMNLTNELGETLSHAYPYLTNTFLVTVNRWSAGDFLFQIIRE